MSYAWIIDKDHQAVLELGRTGRCEDNSTGATGPDDAPEWMVSVFAPGWEPEPGSVGEFHVKGMFDVYGFRLYDGEELFYTGRLITDEGTSERALKGPLRDFGEPNAGCTRIDYPGHPELNS